MTEFIKSFLILSVSFVVLLSLAVLWFATRPRRGRGGRCRGLLPALAVVSLLACLPAVTKGLSWPLRTLVPDWDPQAGTPVGAVVVPTGGSFEDSDGRRWPSRETVRRVALGARLAEEASLPLAVSGGSPEEEPFSEAALAVDLLGLDRGTVLLDTTARNTHENAMAFARLLEPLGIRDVIVVTNGVHMPRLSASLRAAGFRVQGQRLGIHLDSPLQAKDFVPSNSGLGYLHHIASGYAGIVYYLARGRFSIADLLGMGQDDAPGA